MTNTEIDSKLAKGTKLAMEKTWRIGGTTKVVATVVSAGKRDVKVEYELAGVKDQTVLKRATLCSKDGWCVTGLAE